MANVASLLSRPGSDWKQFAAPLPADQIVDGFATLATSLPASLRELYRVCNGGEGSLPFQPWNFILWGLEDVV